MALDVEQDPKIPLILGRPFLHEGNNDALGH